MNDTTVEFYMMNPETDYVIYGDDLVEGMWVLIEPEVLRYPHSREGEDNKLRSQRFCEVTKLRFSDTIVHFIGRYIDGVEKSRSYARTYAWIVKKEVTDGGSEEDPAAT